MILSDVAFVLSSTFAYGSTRVLEASDARDYVFALLGLATDTAELGLHADYSKSNPDVYISLARALVKHGQFIVLSWCRSEHRTEGYLPSWVPDLAHKIHRPFQWVVHCPQTDNFVLEPKYQASRGLQQPPPSSNLLVPTADRALHLHGITLDTVVSCGTSWSELYQRHARTPDVVARVSIRWLRELKMTVEDTSSSASCTEAVWHTSVASTSITPSWSRARWTGPLPAIFHAMYAANFPHEAMVRDPRTRANLALLDAVNIGRRAFVCAGGRVGLGPVETAPGDRVVVVCGAPMPFVVREGLDGKTRLVGEAYVHGAMEGPEEGREVGGGWRFIDVG